MERKIHSVKYAKQRRFLLVLPLLTLPFLTLMFWGIGGGKGNAAEAQSNVQQGLNLKLPDAKLKDDKTLNKLSFYDQAALDLAKTKEAEKLDPYWRKSSNDSGFDNRYSAVTGNGIDTNQLKVYNKLDELKKALNKNQETSGINNQANAKPDLLKSFSSSKDADRLQLMMQKMHEDKTEDPEISQLNEMLDKVQAIQNPNQIKSNASQAPNQNFTVAKTDHRADISLFNSDRVAAAQVDTNITVNSGNAFYSIVTFEANNDSNFNNTIEAIIPETQTIVSGSTIKLAFTNEVTIQNVTIPSGTFVYGITSLSNERLNIDINSIRYQSSILPVSLNVYDMDGQEGIYIPGSINRTVAKESAGNAIGGMNPTTIDPSIGAQAVTAGIEAAKTLANKKIKLIKMTVRAGYKVLLKVNHNK